MSTSANSALSFQGLSTGIQTDALVSAILAQDGVGVVRMQAQETQNTATSTALTTMKTQLNSLMVSLAAVQDTFNARTVTSTDTTSTYATATASGAAAASYDLSVGTVATKGRISATMVNGAPTNLAVADPTAPIFSGTEASFAVQGTDGATQAFTVPSNNNSLNGLRDAINASGAGVTASVINTGSGATPYQLVISANDTGTGKTNGVVTLAAIDNPDANGNPDPGNQALLNASLGIKGGTLTGSFNAPTGIGTPTSGAVADPTAAIFSGTQASFAVQGTDGITKTFTLTSSDNSLNGLRDAINTSGAGVTASIINTGSSTTPYQLVLSANSTGPGITNGVITLAAINNPDKTGNPDPTNPTLLNTSLGIDSGTLMGTFAAPTGLMDAGAVLLTSATSGVSAVNAVFTLNGVQLTRQSNAVSDAVDGVTFNLLKGGETGTTTLTVAQDTSAATTGMQNVITQYNTLLTTYKTASTSTKNADGSINQAPLGGNQTASSIINQLQSALTGASAGLAGTSAYTNLSSLGVTTNSDGTLSLSTVTFQNALKADPAAALRLFTFSGRSTNGAVTVTSGGAQTITGSVGFTINSYTPGGAVSGTFMTANGHTTLTGTNGTLYGTGDLAGLSLSVTGTGSGTLTLARGAGQAASDLITQDVDYGTGALSAALTNMTTQNNYLDLQIAQGQAMLAQRKTTLQNQFSQMEVAVAQLKASASSLIGA